MRKLFLFLLLCVCTGVSAQRIDKPGEEYDYFCTIFKQYGEKNVLIFIQNSSKAYVLLDENDEPIDFKNIANILTYMSKRGWEHVTTNLADTGESLMKKRVTKDEDALKNLNLAEIPYKKNKR